MCPLRFCRGTTDHNNTRSRAQLRQMSIVASHRLSFPSLQFLSSLSSVSSWSGLIASHERKATTSLSKAMTQKVKRKSIDNGKPRWRRSTEKANIADQIAGPTMLATEATDDARPFSWPRRSGVAALLMAKEKVV